MSKLKGKLDDIIELLVKGKTYREIAESHSVALTTLFDFLHLPEHSARAREALELSADLYADKAEEVLKDAKSTMTEIQRARELAQHYRWKASKRAPKRYGDRLDVTSDGKAIPAPVINIFPDNQGE